ncbi:hypothetical protein BASA82_000652 [Batrachochytrium salamandrivorans]|nr:hypothetical protein BASA82_000652 [Batrachochytrium salamandrivorans]
MTGELLQLSLIEEESNAGATTAATQVELPPTQLEAAPVYLNLEARLEPTDKRQRMDTAAAETQSQTTVAETQLQTAVAETQLQTTVAETQLQTAVAETQLQTALTETQPQTTVVKTQPQTTVAEAQPQATVTKTQPQTAVVETQLQTTATKTQPQTAVVEPQLQTAAAKPQPQSDIAKTQAAIAKPQPQITVAPNSPFQAKVISWAAAKELVAAQPQPVSSTLPKPIAPVSTLTRWDILDGQLPTLPLDSTQSLMLSSLVSSTPVIISTHARMAAPAKPPSFAATTTTTAQPPRVDVPPRIAPTRPTTVPQAPTLFAKRKTPLLPAPKPLKTVYSCEGCGEEFQQQIQCQQHFVAKHIIRAAVTPK